MQCDRTQDNFYIPNNLCVSFTKGPILELKTMIISMIIPMEIWFVIDIQYFSFH